MFRHHQAFEIHQLGINSFQTYLVKLPLTWWAYQVANVKTVQFFLLDHNQASIGYGEFLPEVDKILWLWREKRFCERIGKVKKKDVDNAITSFIKQNEAERKVPPGVTLGEKESLMVNNSYYSPIFTDDTSNSNPVVWVRSDFQNSIHGILAEKKSF